MPIIKRVQPVAQRSGRSRIGQHDADDNQKLSEWADVGGIAAASAIGLIGLLLIAWLLLPVSGKIVPFVVAGALPLFTLVVVFYQAIVYRRQWNAMLAAMKQTDRVIDKMQAQVNEIQKQSGILDKTLAETAKMAEHSERGIEVARENTEYAQRAYVTVTQKAFTGTGFSVAIENSGNTPAREVMVSWLIDAGTAPPKALKLGETGGKLPTTIFLGLLAPRSPEAVFIPCNRSLTAEEEQDYGEWPDILHWWVTGSIYYRDIFQESPVDYRLTEFCFFYDQQAQAVRANYSGNDEKEGRESKKDKGNPN